jgi:pimeloyl-ACP methyl ester carboxylesterase
MCSDLRPIGIVSLIACALLSTMTSLTAQDSPQLREGYASVPGARLFYVVSSGTGTPVVFLHAATGTTRAWQYQVPAFTRAGYRFIAYDRRGWGKTVVDPGGSAGTGADDLLGLLDTLRVDRVHLVATAGGGFVAFDFALSYPERLRSLTVADSIGGVRDQEVLDLETRIRPPEFDALPPDLRELGPMYRATNPEGTRRWLEIEKESRPLLPRTSTLQLAFSVPMRNQLSLALFEQIRVPALILAGGADMTAPPPLKKLFAARIKGSEFVVVPNTGHSTYWEDPESFNRAVLEFIRKH